MTAFSIIVAVAEETEPVDSAGGLGIGALALLIAVALILGLMGWLFVNSRRSRASSSEAAPPNQSPPASDDELENTKLTKILRAALVGAALLAIALPWYAANEPDRQAEAAVAIEELDIEEGGHWFSTEGFGCADCHGPLAGGGAAAYTEERSGVEVSWDAPALDDVTYRYDDEEVEYWIVFGRANSPMPANGLEGGGAMTVQEVDQTIAWIRSVQVSQADAFARAVPDAEAALARIEGGELATISLINVQQGKIDEVKAAPAQFEVVGAFPEDIKDLFQADGTCTDETAELIGATCGQPGPDSDRDGVSDPVEKELTAIAAVSMETIRVRVCATEPSGEGEPPNPVTCTFQPNPLYDVRFDPFIAFTNETPEGPVPDLVTAEELLDHLETDVLLLGVTTERQIQFLGELAPGLQFLEQALIDQPWQVDFDQVAADMGVSLDDAKLAVGLYNSQCARCHTGGYSAGPAFEQGAGSGAMGPALWEGRSVVQFPDIEDQISFIITGSQNAVGYGVNGIGRGWMPGFGNVLSAEQIELIVKYERTL